MMNPWKTLRGLPKSLFMLAAATLINRAGTMVLPFLVLYLTRSVGLPAEQAGAMLVLWGAMSLVSAPIAGRLCDRFGSHKVVIGSLLSSSVTMLVFPLAQTPMQIAIAVVVLSLTGEAFRPASMVLYGLLAPEGKRKQAFALQRLAVNLGMSVGPAVGGLLATVWFAGIFVVDGLTALASAVVLLLVFRPNLLAIQPRAEDTPSGAKRAYKDGAFLFFLAVLAANAFVFFQIDAAMPLYTVRDLGLSERTFGLLFTVNTVIIILVEVPLNGAMANWRTARAMALGAALMALGFGSMGLARGAWSMAATVVVWTFGEMILFPTSAAHVADISPQGRSGEYMGAFSMAFGVPFAIAPWAGTVVLERYGGQVLWAGVLVVGMTSAALMLRIRSAQL